ncbi:transcriptional regulator [Lasius niger]|uniref:Transcriptional regulator n=1 Tax=Lasius niger TaxID=67767 RepID=A0A0J7K2M5_LASNI|nr:transcriptional regulator [Lasius niger]
MLPVFAETGKLEAKEQPLEHQENEIDVQGERNDKACPITVRQGKILGASHGTHTKYLPSVNIPYRESFTFFSVADGENTYLVRRQGSLHVRDYVGVIVSAPCRQTVAEVAQVGALSMAGTDAAAKGQ